MAQYRIGTITVTNGSATVTGAGTAWLANVKVGDLLWLGYGIPMGRVACVNSDTQLTLEAAWAGASGSGLTYGIVRDFEPKTGAPLLAHGDPNTNDLFNRAVTTLAGVMALKTLDNFSPLDYGAVADGATDSGAALALALAAAAGGTLTIRGRYLSSTSLTVPANTTLAGAGELVFDGGHALIVSDGCVIDGLTISGATPTDNAAIQVIDRSNVTIRGVTVVAPGKAGIYVIGSTNVTIDGWRVTDAPYAAITLHGSTAIKIGAGTLSGGDYQGIYIAGNCTDVIIDRVHCLASSGGHAGIGLQGYGGTDLPGWPAAGPSDRVTVSNCLVEDYGLLGIEFWGGSTNVTITNCIIRRSMQWGFGLSLDSVIGATVSNVTAINCTFGIENASSVNAVYSNIRGLGCEVTLSLTGNSTPTLTGADGTGVVVNGLICQDCTGSSIGTINTASRIRINGVVVRNYSGGHVIRVMNATDVEIRHGSLEANFSAPDNNNFVIADGSRLLIDDISLRATGSVPSVSLQAYQQGILTIGRVWAHGDAFQVVASAGADGVSDIRSLDGDSGFASYGMDHPLSKGVGGSLATVNGVGSSRRTIRDTGANRWIRFKVKRTDNFAPILHVIRWSGSIDGQHNRGGIVTMAFCGGTAIKDPEVGLVGGSPAVGGAPTWTSYIFDSDGYPCWDLRLPVSAGIDATIESSGLGVQADDWLIYRVSDAASTGAANQLATGSGGVSVFATSPTLTTPTATMYSTIDGPAGNYRYLRLASGGITRWAFGVDYQAESGDNAGSHIFMHRCADDGSFIENTLDIDRSTGVFAFTHPPTAPTPPADTNNAQFATTAYVLGQASGATPTMAGTAAAGSSTRWARGDHVHPTDTSRAPLASPQFTGAPSLTPSTIDTGLTINTVGGSYQGIVLATNAGRGNLTLLNNGSQVIGLNAGTGLISTSGAITSNSYVRSAGEVQATSANAFRMVQGNYGAFWRNDGGAVYLLLTNSGDQWGGFNSLRPFGVTLSTGAVSFGHAVTVAGGVTGFDANGLVGLRSYTVATLPTASPAGRMIYVSDGTSNKRQAVSDGSNWRWPDGAVVS